MKGKKIKLFFLVYKESKTKQKVRHFSKMLGPPQFLPQWVAPADFPGKHVSLKESPVGA